MSERRFQFADIESAACVECGEVKPTESLDRELWCDDCRGRATRVAARWGRVAGLVGSVLLAIWIGVAVAPSGRMLIGWAVVVLVSYRIVGRLGRELIFGVLRARRTAARRRF